MAIRIRLYEAPRPADEVDRTLVAPLEAPDTVRPPDVLNLDTPRKATTVRAVSRLGLIQAGVEVHDSRPQPAQPDTRPHTKSGRERVEKIADKGTTLEAQRATLEQMEKAKENIAAARAKPFVTQEQINARIAELKQAYHKDKTIDKDEYTAGMQEVATWEVDRQRIPVTAKEVKTKRKQLERELGLLRQPRGMRKHSAHSPGDPDKHRLHLTHELEHVKHQQHGILSGHAMISRRLTDEERMAPVPASKVEHKLRTQSGDTTVELKRRAEGAIIPEATWKAGRKTKRGVIWAFNSLRQAFGRTSEQGADHELDIVDPVSLEATLRLGIDLNAMPRFDTALADAMAEATRQRKSLTPAEVGILYTNARIEAALVSDYLPLVLGIGHDQFDSLTPRVRTEHTRTFVGKTWRKVAAEQERTDAEHGTPEPKPVIDWDEVLEPSRVAHMRASLESVFDDFHAVISWEQERSRLMAIDVLDDATIDMLADNFSTRAVLTEGLGVHGAYLEDPAVIPAARMDLLQNLLVDMAEDEFRDWYDQEAERRRIAAIPSGEVTIDWAVQFEAARKANFIPNVFDRVAEYIDLAEDQALKDGVTLDDAATLEQAKQLALRDLIPGFLGVDSVELDKLTDEQKQEIRNQLGI